MKKIILLFILLASISFPQTKYLIYFKDKGIAPGQSLSKASALYKEALSMLTPRAIARREKVMPPGHIITYEDLPIRKDYVDKIESLGIKIENELRWFNAVSAYLTDEQKNDVLALPFVEKVDPVRIIYLKHGSPETNPGLQKSSGGPLPTSDYGPSYGQYELSDIPIVQSNGINGKGVIIGILDNGFHWRDHESLATRKVIDEYNFVFHDSSTAWQPGDTSISGLHGTYVFSIIGGYKDSSIIGPAYNASFILAKTEDDRSESRVEEDNYAAALEWMEELGVDITTSSLGYNIFDTASTSYTYEDLNGNTTISAKALSLAFQRGVLTFTAAGNEGDSPWKFIDTPADAFNVIAVGAVYSNNTLAPFSSHGPTADGRIKPDVVAQGVSVYGADVKDGFNKYFYESGTSAATPIAAGIGAMLLSAFPYLNNVQARQIIMETSDNYNNPNNDIGYGLISAEKALAYPNISDSSGVFTINKIFFPQNGIQSNTATIYYSTGTSNFSSAPLNHDTLKYYFTVPQSLDGQAISFYFTYSDSLGNTVREPASNYYSLNIGSFEVVIENIPHPSSSLKVLGASYPNPLTAKTSVVRINFYAAANGNAKLILYNILGQKIKTLYSGVAYAGTNTISWNGRNENGELCGSGVYFYRLNIGGKNYFNKLMIVK